MYKDGDYRGLSLEEVILAIHDELRENRAFLQMSLLDPDPDNRPAEDLRIRKIMELAGVMENVLDTLMRDTCGPEAEAGHDGEEIPCREESEGGVDVEYRSHTPGKPDESENIEQDWNMDAVGDEAEDVKKKKDKTKKERKIKRIKKERRRGKRNKQGEPRCHRAAFPMPAPLFPFLKYGTGGVFMAEFSLFI